jgi:hypothetical protein
LTRQLRQYATADKKTAPGSVVPHQDGTIQVLCEKTSRIVDGKLPAVEVFQRHIGLIGEDRAHQRAFTRLTRSSNRDRWETAR